MEPARIATVRSSVRKEPLKLKAIDIQPFLSQLEGEMRLCIEDLQNEKYCLHVEWHMLFHILSAN